MSRVNFDLYLIADTGQVQGNVVSSVKKAIDGGVKGVQLRGKKMPTKELLKTGEKLRRLTQENSVRFFINDRIDVAMALDADGIHLGQESLSARLARKIAGDRFIIGVSTHNLKEAREAEAGGADFVTFGPVFATPSKLVYGPPVGLGKLFSVTKDVKIPVFAIGGIKVEKVKSVIEKGAYGVAVISAILNSRSIYRATVCMVEELNLLKSDRSMNSSCC